MTVLSLKNPKTTRVATSLRNGCPDLHRFTQALGEAKNLFHNKIQNAFNVWIDTLVQVLMEAGIERSQAQQRAEDAMLANSGFSYTSSKFR